MNSLKILIRLIEGVVSSSFAYVKKSSEIYFHKTVSHPLLGKLKGDILLTKEDTANRWWY